MEMTIGEFRSKLLSALAEVEAQHSMPDDRPIQIVIRGKEPCDDVYITDIDVFAEQDEYDNTIWSHININGYI